VSMPIQRQSEQFSIFDDGPRYARDHSSTDLPRGLAGLINSTGPRIQAGLLNTRQAVNTDGMHPDSHAYHTELPPGRGGEISWVDDAENFGRNPRREWNPDFGYEPTDEDERRQEGVAEDDDSGYNWGPEPRRASRHPFDRTAGAWEDFFGDEMPSPFAGKDPENFFTDWLERGPKPGENDDPRRDRKGGLSRTAACQSCGGEVYHISGEGFVHADTDDQNGWDIDEHHQAEPDEDDDRNLGLSSLEAWHERREARRFLAFDWQAYSAASPDVEGHHARLENGHTLSVHQDRSKPHEGWSWGLTVPKGIITDADGSNPQEMRELVTGGGKNWEKIHGAYASHHLPSREHAIRQAQEAYQTLYPMGTNTGGHDSGNDYSDLNSYMKHLEGRRVALAPAPQDPAMAPQVPVGGGFLPGHRVGLDWRDRTIGGTVIANDGQVHIRWDEGQYTSEDPAEVHLL